jgi:hypothetical protein
MVFLLTVLFVGIKTSSLIGHTTLNTHSIESGLKDRKRCPCAAQSDDQLPTLKGFGLIFHHSIVLFIELLLAS